ncbi:MAG TPA: 2-hydroxyglutaryl-CoA dehydratase [Clostridia bacterium]|nr:2-hydroxyglutaryl-CoA dehydratase [Clostridia bacterium]
MLNEQGELFCHVRPTGWSPREAAREGMRALLEQTGYAESQVKKTVATGYGRIALNFADKAITEITCHGRGASFLVPEADIVIDIGGQDSKALKISPEGRVLDFLMNDKCAAGTGRFLQVMALALGVEVSELADLAKDKEPVSISNMCTVFAETEVIGLLAQGVDKGAIVAGLHQSIAKRIGAMVSRLGGPERKTVFTGGVALNSGVQASIAEVLGVPVIVHRHSQEAGAIGAALLAREML